MSINRTLLKYSIGGKLMKATGIVRRIDDLGRIVIPKEIRRVLGFGKVTHWKYLPITRVLSY